MVKLTDKTQLGDVAVDDWMEIVDISDTTGSPEGTTKKMEPQDFLNTGIPKALIPSIPMDTTVSEPSFQEGRMYWDNVHNCLAIQTTSASTLQVGQEFFVQALNDTGSQINDGQIVQINGASVSIPTVDLAIADPTQQVLNALAVATEDVPDATASLFTSAGTVRNVDTSAFTPGQQLYLSGSTAGEITNVKPTSPDFTIRIGYCLISSATVGQIYVSIEIEPPIVCAFDGMQNEQLAVTVVEDGGTLYAEVETTEGSNNATFILESDFWILDTTTGSGTDGKARVALTAGASASSFTENYVYVEKSGTPFDAQLSASTSLPTGEFSWVAKVLVPDATTFLTTGAMAFQHTDDSLCHDGRGVLSFHGEKLRSLGTTYENGILPSITIDTGPSPDSVTVDTTSGQVYQLHRYDFPAFTSPTTYYVVNDPVTPYDSIADFNEITADALGGSLVNRSFNLVLWASSDNGTDDKLFLNLPIGSYTTAAGAIADASNFTVTTVPAEFSQTAFLIARFILQTTGGGVNWINLAAANLGVDFVDLRGVNIGFNSSSAGITTGATTFADDEFEVFDNVDVTKSMAFEVSGVTTSTTRTYTAPDNDGVMATINNILGTTNQITATDGGDTVTLSTPQDLDTGTNFQVGTLGIGTGTLGTYELRVVGEVNIQSSTEEMFRLDGTTGDAAIVLAANGAANGIRIKAELNVTDADLVLTVGGSERARLSFGGDLTIAKGDGFIIGSSTPFSDSTGTLTLQNVDVLDATTEATIEAAIDTLTNLTSAPNIALGGDLSGTTGSAVVGNDTHDHTSVTITLAASDLTDYTDLTLVDGSRAFSGTVGGVTPVAGADLATKDYVDSLTQGISWQDPVIDKDLTTAPVSPSADDRYIIAGTGGAWSTGTVNDIAEYDGSAWDFTTPTEGFATWVLDEDTNYTFNGTSWVKFGSTIDHGNLQGLGDDDHTQYHTDARALTWLGTRSTTDLPEGTNLYYTDARVETKIDAYLVAGEGVDIVSGLISGEDATTANKGIASFHPTNFTVTVGEANTIQDIATSASPTFVGLTLSGLTSGSVLFAGASGVISQDNSNIYYDNANNRLGLLTTSPEGTLHVKKGASGASFAGDEDIIIEATGDARMVLATAGSGTCGIYFSDNAAMETGHIEYAHSSDSLSFRTAGVNGLVIDSSQKITTGTWEATTIAVDQGGTGQTSYTNGQLLIGNTTGNTLAKGTLTGTADQITVTNGGGTITLSTPQGTGTSSTPQFAGLGIGIAGASGTLRITSATEEMLRLDGDTSTDAAIVLASAGAANGIRIRSDLRTTDADLDFDVGGSTRMLIGHDGFVGIGEPTPATFLHITDGDGTSPTWNTDSMFILQNNSAVGDNTKMSIVSGTSGESSVLFGDSGGDARGEVRYDNATDRLDFYTNGTRAININSSQLTDFEGEVTMDQTLVVTGIITSDGGYEGVPWEGPKWSITDAGSGTQALLSTFSGQPVRRYQLPFDIQIQGVIVSGDDEANGSSFQFGIYVDQESTADETTTSGTIADFESVNEAFGDVLDVSAGSYITFKSEAGNGQAELTLIPYGRTNE